MSLQKKNSHSRVPLNTQCATLNAPLHYTSAYSNAYVALSTDDGKSLHNLNITCTSANSAHKLDDLLVRFEKDFKSPIIQCTVDSKKIYICIDSGCENILCTKSLALQIYGNQLNTRMSTYSGNVYVDAQNNIMTMVGSVHDAVISIGSLQFTETLHIYNSRHNQMQALLGFNILRKHGLALYPDGLQIIKSSCNKLSPINNELLPILSLEGCLIPSERTKLISATIDFTNTNCTISDLKDKLMICHSEDVDNCDQSELSLYYQYVFVSDNNIFKIQYKNTQKIDIYIEKRQLLGYCESMIEPSQNYVDQQRRFFADFDICCRLLYTDDKSCISQDLQSALAEQELGQKSQTQLEKINFNIQSQNPDHELFLRKVFQEFPDLAAKHPWDVQPLKGSIISFKLKPDAQPIAQRPFTVPMALASKAQKLMKRLQELGLVRLSKSPWSTNVIVLRKKPPERAVRKPGDIAMDNEDDNGSVKTNQLRLCFDSRLTNSLLLPTVANYPIPSTWDILQKLSGAKWLGSLDAANAYWGMRISDNSAKLLAFSWFGTSLEPTACPQGIKYAPVLYQARLHKVMVNANLVNFGQKSKQGHQSGCQVYQDNILLHSDDIETYKSLLYQVLKVLSENNFRLKLQKSHFFLNSEAIIFGFHINIAKGIIQPDKKKVEKMMLIQKPKSRKALRAFLGACFYFNSLCPKMQHIASPLTSLTSTKIPYKWDSACDISFQNMKKLLATMPLVYLYNPNLPILCYSDACIRSFVAHSCYQWDSQLQKLLPIIHWCHKLSPSQQNLSQHACELLSILMFCTKQAHLIYSNKVFLFSDCKSLQYAIRFSPKNQTVCRWWNYIKSFEISIYFLSCENPTFHVTDLMTRSFSPTSYINKRITQGDIENLPILSFLDCPPMTLLQIEKIVKSFHKWFDIYPKKSAEAAISTGCLDKKGSKPATALVAQLQIWNEAFPIYDILGVQHDNSGFHFCEKTDKISINFIQQIPAFCWSKITSFQDLKDRLHHFLPNVSIAEFIKAQTEDVGIKRIWDLYFSKNDDSQKFKILGGVFCKKIISGKVQNFFVFLPRKFTFQVIKKTHAKCNILHLGAPKCRQELTKYFIMKDFKSIFTSVVQKCKFCTLNQPAVFKQPINQGVQIFLAPRLCISVDICEFQSKWSTGCFLTIMCPFSLYVVCHSVKKTATAEDIILLISECYIKYFGNVRYCIKDNQKSMTSTLIDTALSALKIQPVLICPLNSRSNNGAERMNHHITKMLSFIHQKFPLKEKYLDFYLTYCCLAWNSTPSAFHGQTPSLLHTGFESRVNEFLLTKSFQILDSVPQILQHLHILYEFLFQLMEYRSKTNKILKEKNLPVHRYKAGQFCIVKDSQRNHEGRAGFKLRPRYKPDLYRIWKVGKTNVQLIPWTSKFEKHIRPLGRGCLPKIQTKICKMDQIKKIPKPDNLVKWDESHISNLALKLEQIQPVLTVIPIKRKINVTAGKLEKMLGQIIQSSAFGVFPIHMKHGVRNQYINLKCFRLNEKQEKSSYFPTGDHLVTINSHLSELKSSSSSLNDHSNDHHFHNNHRDNQLRKKWKRIYKNLHPHERRNKQPPSSWFKEGVVTSPWWQRNQEIKKGRIDNSHSDFDDHDFYVQVSRSDIIEQVVNDFDRATEEIRTSSSRKYHTDDDDDDDDSDNQSNSNSDGSSKSSIRSNNDNNDTFEQNNDTFDQNNDTLVQNNDNQDKNQYHQQDKDDNDDNDEENTNDEDQFYSPDEHHQQIQDDDRNKDDQQHSYRHNSDDDGNEDNDDNNDDGNNAPPVLSPVLPRSSRGRILRPTTLHPLDIQRMQITSSSKPKSSKPKSSTPKSSTPKTYSIQTGKVGSRLSWKKSTKKQDSSPSTSKSTKLEKPQQSHLDQTIDNLD